MTYYMVKDVNTKDHLEVQLIRHISLTGENYTSENNYIIAYSKYGDCILTNLYEPEKDKQRVITFVETYDLNVPEML